MDLSGRRRAAGPWSDCAMTALHLTKSGRAGAALALGPVEYPVAPGAGEVRHHPIEHRTVGRPVVEDVGTAVSGMRRCDVPAASPSSPDRCRRNKGIATRWRRFAQAQQLRSSPGPESLSPRCLPHSSTTMMPWRGMREGAKVTVAARGSKHRCRATGPAALLKRTTIDDRCVRRACGNLPVLAAVDRDARAGREFPCTAAPVR